MFFFKKKKEGIEEEKEEELEEIPSAKKKKAGKFDVGLDRLTAKVEALDEIRKAYSERFARLSEQIGELRGMIVENEKEIQEIDAKASRASNLVSEIKPEKLLETIRLEEAKVEALKAKIESNEAIMDKIFEEMKELRSKITLFKGVDELLKLSKEVKEELMVIKKVEANIENHANKFEGIYLQAQKRFIELDKIKSILNELEKKLSDFDKKAKEVKDIKNLEVINKLADEQKKYSDKLNRISKNIFILEKMDLRTIDFGNYLSKKDFDGFKEEINNKLKAQPLPPAPKPKMDNFVSKEEFFALKEEIGKLSKTMNSSEAFKMRLGELVSKREFENLKSEIKGEFAKEIEDLRSKLNEVKKQPEVKPESRSEILNKCNKKITDIEMLIRKGKLDEGTSAYQQLSSFYNELLKTDIPLNEKNMVYRKITELHKLLTKP